jgi:hypothetical protein
MHRFVRCFGFMILSVALIVPTLAPALGQTTGGDTKKDAKKSTPDLKLKVKADWVGEFGGKLTELKDSEDKGLVFTVKVNYKYLEVNPDVQRQILQSQQTLAQQQQQLVRAKSRQDQQNAINAINNTQQQLQQQAAQLYRTKELNLDVKCKAAEKFRVRKFEPVQQVDPDSGEFIKMTKEKLEELRGREGYPGYKADSKILQTGQYVAVYIWKDSKTPANFLDKDKMAKMKIDDLKDEMNNFRYDAIMVYVMAEPPPKAP